MVSDSDGERDLRDIPHDGAFDATWSLLREGYEFIPNRCSRLGSDIFRTRLMLRQAVCLQGPDAARFIYESPGLTRRGSMPQTTLRLLQDKGSVQQLDGEAHRHRKGLFIGLLMEPDTVATLEAIFREEWIGRLPEWERREWVSLFDEANLILTRSVCRWAGVPMSDDRFATAALTRMVEYAGHMRPATLSSLWQRRRMEGHVRRCIEQVRKGDLCMGHSLPLRRIADFRDFSGAPLEPDIAAVETINILRPVVAVGRYIAFAALLLHRHPEWHQRFRDGDEKMLEGFAEEVRRISPFFPFVGARAVEEVEWRGYRFPSGQWFLLDLYGTLSDGRFFPRSEDFRPERAISWRDQDCTFIPQGAGSAPTTHRCPGEMITVGLIRQAVRLLCRSMDYNVPRQDLEVRMNRIPALPESGFTISGIKARRLE
ncbi:cytochrome P450 [Pseudorhizobium endolithicum]|uniref:Cytochrome P450 n=1 Tax=Pseudorhizobium endolithicum TaxID=1191678 RepID=A0ABM8PQ01_9HYPH|nr:cytochrome P450 [Pseudorhizobium endolithicum]CAD7041693.1 cytochrome P450 [Pseudorhizobium endolithicum]